MGFWKKFLKRVGEVALSAAADVTQPSGFKCLECGHDKFFEGPHGGMSINFWCAKCYERYNDMGVFGIDFGYGKASPELRKMYGDWSYTPSTTTLVNKMNAKDKKED